MYTITERLNADAPSDSDPLAQAMPRHSGWFDLRCGGKVLFGNNNLQYLRKMQATANTKSVMDNLLPVAWRI